MKTNYNILWIEDEPENIEDDKESIREFLDTFGIDSIFDIVEAKSDGSIHDKIQQSLKNPDLDIIMVDFNMPGLKGDELIDMIRGTDHVFLPVIFYSSSTVEQLFAAVKDKSLDGVYISNRKRLADKAESVLRSFLAKEQTTKQARGLLMEGVSEVDANFKEIFSKIWSKSSDEIKHQIISYVHKIFSDRQSSHDDKMKKVPTDIKGFEQYIIDRFSTTEFDTYSRWRVIKKFSEQLGYDPQMTSILTAFAQKSSEAPLLPLNSLRNNYAHKTRLELEGQHSGELCIRIRKELKEQLLNVAKLKEV